MVKELDREIRWVTTMNVTHLTMVSNLLKYIPEGATVWCPFDTIDSDFKQISKQGKVINSYY